MTVFAHEQQAPRRRAPAATSARAGAPQKEDSRSTLRRTVGNAALQRLPALVLEQAGDMLSRAPNEPELRLAVPQPYRRMVEDFFIAASGHDRSGGKHVEVSASVRRARLDAGLRAARPLIAGVEKQGPAARAHLAEVFWTPYRAVEAAIWAHGARELVNQSVTETPRAEQPAEAVEDQTEKYFQALHAARVALNRLVIAEGRLQSPAVRQQFNKTLDALAKGKSLPDALKFSRGMTWTLHLRAVLDTIDAVLKIRDYRDRKKEAERHPNIFATTTDILGRINHLLEGTVIFLSAATAAVALPAGKAEAMFRLRMGTYVLRTLGIVSASLQLAYGLSMMFDPKITDEQRHTAFFNVAFGAAGAGALPTLFGGRALWPTGPVSYAILYLYFSYEYVRAVRNMKEARAAGGLREAFASLRDSAFLIQTSARPLRAALLHLQLLSPEMGLYGGMQAEARRYADITRFQLKELIRLATTPTALLAARGPADFPVLGHRFLPLREQLAEAKTPESVLALALQALEMIRTAFAQSEEIARVESIRLH